MEKEKLKMRTSAKRSFTRLNNIVCQSMSQDNDLDLIEERFEELKRAWQKVEELHDQYVSTKAEEPEDEAWLEEIFETFSKTQERFFKYRKSNKSDDKFKIKLKPVELPRFAGSIRDYPRFKKDFQRQVLPHTSPESAAFTLRQCLSREVQEKVALVDDDVDKMLQKLEEEYGDPSLTTDLIVSEIKNYDVQGKRERLVKFIDIVEKGYYDLSRLGLDSELSNTIVVGIIETKLPEETRQKWVDRVCSDDSKVDMRNKFPSLLKFLQEVRRSMKYMSTELREPKACIKSTSHPSSSTPSTGNKSTTGILNSQTIPTRQNTNWSCQACGQGRHGLAKCSQYQRMNVEDRWDVARKAGVCFQCLGPHLARQCKSKTCPTCHQPHHSSLHRRSPAAASPTGPVASYQPRNQRFGSASSGQPDSRPPSHHRGQEDHLRASSQHHQTHQLNQPQHHPGNQPPQSQRYSATNHRFRCFSQTAVVVAVGPRAHRSARLLLDGGSDASYIRTSLAEELGLEVIESGTFACVGFQERIEEPKLYNQVEVRLQSRHDDRMKTVRLWSTDRLCAPVTPTAPPTVDSKVNLADDFSGGRVDILIGTDQLYDIVLWDQIALEEGLRAIETIFGYVIHGRSDDMTTDQPTKNSYHCHRVEQMWNLDAVGITEDDVKKEDYPQPTWNKEEGRYEMGLLWSSDRRPVTNFQATSNRTNRMMEKLDDAKLLEYNEQLKGLYQDSVIEDSIQSVATSSAFFLPHRGLHRNGKLRIVFDGSARDGAGVSLNGYLEPGENLLHRLVAVLLEFRTRPVACQADIKSAFHQVGVREADRQYLQFLWQQQVLRFKRVPFGLSCSPFMLLKTVILHLDKYMVTDQELCEKIQRGIYMDDICISFSSREDAVEGMKRTKEIFQEASMKLHKMRLTGDSSPEGKVLGMMWDTTTDHLAVEIPNIKCPSTKSELLSTISKPFDPLGLLVPWLIGGKVLFQNTWKSVPPLTWDENLPDELQEKVRTWWITASDQTVWIPRPLTTSELTDDSVYHVFCDASSVAYCATVYVVQEGESRLLMAKGRLAPLDPHLTIPRLELMAALIGSRLMSFVQDTLHLENPTVLYWTDSTDVLFWLRNPKPRKVFVENRVSSILQLTKPGQWRHVKGTENPADLGTRGILLPELTVQKKWWKGPQFILDDDSLRVQSEMPKELSIEAQRELKKETRSPTATMVTTTSTPSSSNNRLFDITSCSSLKQAVIRTAWVLRFLHNVKSSQQQRRSGPLTPEERRQALHYWIREAQGRTYSQELESLKNGEHLPANSPITKLRPQLDEDGIICAVTRTNEPLLPVLPEFAHITSLIIDEAHHRCFHQGTRATLALLSGEYLVRRRSVKRVVTTCHRCRRYKGLNFQAADGSLPSFRTEPSRPFSKVGVDFFGPLHVDEGTKVWVLLITCATSRAVHLELVRSQSTEDVKLALRRFFALRGTPDLIVSDNAKTFHSLLSHIPRSVTWRFIPEAAPWWGGFWERMVGVTKKCLKITLHLCHLSYEELAVILYELAFHLNLRPLTSIDEELLTPAHFLFGVTCIRGVISPSGDHSDYLGRAWRHQRRVSEHLIRRWTTEYVATLRSWTVSPRGRPIRLPKVGDVVLVHGEGPRGRWPVARVESLITGPDGCSRAAIIKMRCKRTRRPISKLYHLEAHSPNE